MKKVIIKAVLSDKVIQDKIGDFFDLDNSYKIIKKNTDLYYPDGIIFAIYRKNIIPKKLRNLAIETMYNATLKPKNKSRRG